MKSFQPDRIPRSGNQESFEIISGKIEEFYKSVGFSTVVLQDNGNGRVTLIVDDNDKGSYIGKNGKYVKGAQEHSGARNISVVKYSETNSAQRTLWESHLLTAMAARKEREDKERAEALPKKLEALRTKFATANRFQLTTDTSLRDRPGQKIWAKSYPITVYFNDGSSQNLADFREILSKDDIEYIFSEVLPGTKFELENIDEDAIDKLMMSDEVFQAQQPIIEESFRKREEQVKSFFDERTWLFDDHGSNVWLCSDNEQTRFFQLRSGGYSDPYDYYFHFAGYIMSEEKEKRLNNLKTIYEEMGGDKEILKKLLIHSTIFFKKGGSHKGGRYIHDKGVYEVTFSVNGKSITLSVSADQSNIPESTATRNEVFSALFDKKYSSDIDPDHDKIAAQNVIEETKLEEKKAINKEAEQQAREIEQGKLEQSVELAEKEIAEKMGRCPLCNEEFDQNGVCNNIEAHDYENIDFNPGGRYREDGPMNLKLMKNERGEVVCRVRVNTNGTVSKEKWDYIRYGGWDGYTSFETLSVEDLELIKRNQVENKNPNVAEEQVDNVGIKSLEDLFPGSHRKGGRR